MKRIGDLYKLKNPLFSLEFFPPKTIDGEEKLFRTLMDLQSLNPDFVTVTYGAGGSTRGKTFSITEKIIKDFGLTAASHFTSVCATKDEILTFLMEMKSRGIANIMVLRGDPPVGAKEFDIGKSAFAHASELVKFIKENGFDFGMGGACYPEKHPEAKSLEEDVANLKFKVDAGVDFLVTQLFFANEAFYKFVKLANFQGINVPIIPGIMPITSFQQIERFRSMTECLIPEDLVVKLTQLQDNKEEFMSASIDFSVNQCLDLLSNDAPGIHFYTLNQSTATLQILQKIKSKLAQEKA